MNWISKVIAPTVIHDILSLIIQVNSAATNLWQLGALSWFWFYIFKLIFDAFLRTFQLFFHLFLIFGHLFNFLKLLQSQALFRSSKLHFAEVNYAVE